MRRNVYLVFSILGLLGPYAAYALMRRGHESLIGLFAFPSWNTYTAVFAVDLVLSVAAFWVFMILEARRLGMKHWWAYVLATLTVGLSFSLPLFLFFRERRLELAPCND